MKQQWDENKLVLIEEILFYKINWMVYEYFESKIRKNFKVHLTKSNQFIYLVLRKTMWILDK